MGISIIPCSKTVNLSITPPWVFCYCLVNIESKNIVKTGLYKSVQQYIEARYNDTVHIFTDASKDLTAKTGVAVYIPKYKVTIQKRTTNHLSIFSAEMTAIIMALQWVEEVKP